MTAKESDTMIGNTPASWTPKPVEGGFVRLLGEDYYRISHTDQIPPFLMSLVSGADHWLFISSNGGLTAGRTNADSALFPYETEDKIAAHSEQSGGKTIVRAMRDGRTYLWEPFSDRYTGVYRCERHLYKNTYGNKLVFEEVNHDLQLTMRSAWRSSDRFGIIRSCWLQNDSGFACQIDLLDGLQNLLPHGATEDRQTSLSSLLNAYKRNELAPASGLGIFALSATLTDRAEPSESLQATVAWQVGLEDTCYLLCKDQIEAFRHGRALTPEIDVYGKAGAYLVNASFELAPEQSQLWHIVADVNQDSRDVVRLARLLERDRAGLQQALEEDIERGTLELDRYVAAADGLQTSTDKLVTVHHLANVLFNIMRGGIFIAGYQVEKDDLLDFMHTRNRSVLAAQAAWFEALPNEISIRDLYARAAASGIADLQRLCYEYLPLTFSRRHGDPSRPWNSFTINLKQPDGSPRLDYQGNWRDIFQNWEALALAFPHFVEGMIAKFLNATTADGYNPYRVTRDGIEWEVPEPGNPWANIGYWSDHQIIYLQKLLEIAEQVDPGALATLWNRAIFSYADVPYRLRPYEEMLADWYNTIDFDWGSERATESAVSDMGTDGRLLRDAGGEVIHVTMVEKLLVLLLAKLTNLAPEGGIWMNTRRPEWNDANNALVGKGLSVVTVAYLRRFIAFWQAQLAGAEEATYAVNTAVAALFADVQAIFTRHQPHLDSGFSGRSRRAIMDELGTAASAYRDTVYRDGVPPAKAELSGQTLRDFLALAQVYMEHTLRANRRADQLYHAYNILRLDGQGVHVENLYLMLEGQVAILSAGILTAEESLALLYSLRHSDLYRADQRSYMLYPRRTLPGFLEKNRVTAGQVAGSKLALMLAGTGDVRLLIRDQDGVFHFNGHFRNAGDVARTLDELQQEPALADLVPAERDFILDLFENTFNHRAFTGRSGTFFAYEGLGSIYWHMVSKLLLAVQETYLAACTAGADLSVRLELAAAYADIRRGLSFNKSPAEYGAFPTDPYSHTPFGSGARQPGMTGQVKEEILTRMGELGVSVQKGALHFAPALLWQEEFSSAPGHFSFWDATGRQQELLLPVDSLAFTFCQTPVIYTLSDAAYIDVLYIDGKSTATPGSRLDEETSAHILARDGQVKLVHVYIPYSLNHD